MSIQLVSLRRLISSLVEVGASFVVLADNTGLPIATASKKEDDETTETMGALTSLVIPQGEQIAQYLNANFQDAVIHTISQTKRISVLTFALETDPKTAIMIIADPAAEGQVLFEFQKIKEKIISSFKGIATEVRDSASDPFSGSSQANKQVTAFWDTLASRVVTSTNQDSLKRAVLDAKENYIQIFGRWSPILYHMQSFASRKAPDFDLLKKEALSLVQDWKKRSLTPNDAQREQNANS
ncbi:MAG TPA: hypothetical protein VJ044_06020 [Candidatus Hodarchaeales archaeon]|nr:hypothetical protein [Candidatus Hodarchaeales archaeon]